MGVINNILSLFAMHCLSSMDITSDGLLSCMPANASGCNLFDVCGRNDVIVHRCPAKTKRVGDK